MDKENILLQHLPNLHDYECFAILGTWNVGFDQMVILLWQDDGFQQCLQCAVEYQLSDSLLHIIFKG